MLFRSINLPKHTLALGGIPGPAQQWRKYVQSYKMANRWNRRSMGSAKKPTLDQLYKLIGCSTVERQSGYDKDISNRTFDMWMDEESKCKAPEFIKKNERASTAWYEWQSRTGHQCIPGDFIAGNTVVYKKI